MKHWVVDKYTSAMVTSEKNIEVISYWRPGGQMQVCFNIKNRLITNSPISRVGRSMTLWGVVKQLLATKIAVNEF